MTTGEIEQATEEAREYLEHVMVEGLNPNAYNNISRSYLEGIITSSKLYPMPHSVPGLHPNFIKWEFNDEGAKKVIRLAQTGDAIAARLLIDAATVMIEMGKPLPKNLRWYVVKVLKSEIPLEHPKNISNRNKLRDLYIACAIWMVRERGFNPTRNRVTANRESACSIVTEALSRIDIHMTESNVSEIWRRFKHMAD